MLHAVEVQASVVVSFIIEVLEHVEDPHLVAPGGGREPDIPAALV